ncbi:MAG TPA: AAA family ATPase [Bdellovibrionales bacterium]|nr:AAA family ATPase [Bdellovibrionales bacterium]
MERRKPLTVVDNHSPDSAPERPRPALKRRTTSRHHESGQLNLRQLWKLVKINKYVVGSAVVLAVTLTALHSFFSTPIYRASVTLTVMVNNTAALNNMLSSLTGEDELVQKIHALNEYFRSAEMSKRLAQVVERNGTAAFVALTQKGMARLSTNLGLSDPLTSARSTTLTHEAIAAELAAMLTITPNFNNSTMVIEASTPNPELSALLANEAARGLVDINHRIGLRKVQEIKNFLTNQTTELGQRLETLETELATFQAENQMISEAEAERSVYSTLNRHETDYIDAQIRLSTNQQLITRIEKEMRQMKENIAKSDFSGSNLYLSQLQHRLSMLQYQQAMQQSGSGEATSPAEGKRLQDEINGLVQSYQKALDTRDAGETAVAMNPLEYYQRLEQSYAQLKKDNANFAADLAVLEKAIKRQKGEFPKLAANLQHLTELKRSIHLTSDLYLAIRKKLQEAEIQEAGTIKTVDVLSEAQAPSSPYAVPLSFKLSFAVAVGLFFGILFVLTHEALVPCVRHRHDIEQNGIYVLGEVPLAENVGPVKRALIPINDNPNSYEADAFRFIKMRLASHVKHKPGMPAPIVLVTSPRSGNGKTFTSVNLATTLSKAKLKTLLIDMDLRKPSTQKYFDPPEKTIEGLAIDPNLTDQSKITTTVSPFLDVIFGTHHIMHPPEFLETPTVPNFLAEMRKKYDFIIIDSAPILGIIDSSILARMVDHVLFVVEHRKTLREDLAMALHTLREVHHKPLLSILNCVHKEFGYYDNKYYVVRSSQIQTQDVA